MEGRRGHLEACCPTYQIGGEGWERRVGGEGIPFQFSREGEKKALESHHPPTIWEVRVRSVLDTDQIVVGGALTKILLVLVPKLKEKLRV